MTLLVEGVTVRFGQRIVLDRVDLRVDRGRIGAVLGPSGSGKSTLLQVIAGLLRPDSGCVRWDAHDLSRVPVHRRQTGLVFQDAVLFGHLDVAGNVAYGLRVGGVPAAQRESRVAQVLELVGLSGQGRRDVRTLSGGEAQRVALARALAPGPRVVLLDEPFASLDADLRTRLAADVRDLLRDADVAAVLVTHDRSEASRMADHVWELPYLG